MLDKKDIETLRKVIREEVKLESRKTVAHFDSKLLFTKMELKNSISDVETNLELRIDAVEKDLKVVKRAVTKTKKDIKAIIGFFDQSDALLQKRVDKIEHHLSIA